MQIHSRAVWGAQQPTGSEPLKRLDGWVAHWEGPRLAISRHEDCIRIWRGIQRQHMSGANTEKRPWADIAYNFGYCMHGYVFEGRGWRVRSAANGTFDANTRYVSFCYLGGQGDPFTIEAQRALVELNNECVRRGGRERWPHSRFRSTSCAGVTIDRFIQGDMGAALTARAKNIPIVLIRRAHVQDQGDEMIKVDYENVMLGDGPDDTGKGWVWCDIPHDQIVSIKAQGMFPPDDGYPPVPTFGSQMRVTEGHQSVIQIDGGQPGQVINFTVWGLAEAAA